MIKTVMKIVVNSAVGILALALLLFVLSPDLQNSAKNHLKNLAVTTLQIPSVSEPTLDMPPLNLQTSSVSSIFPRSIHGQLAVRLYDSPYQAYPNQMLEIKHNDKAVPLTQSLEAHYGDAVDGENQLTSITLFEYSATDSAEMIRAINDDAFKQLDKDFERITLTGNPTDSWFVYSSNPQYQSDLRMLFPQNNTMLVIKFASGRSKQEIIDTAKEYINYLASPQQNKQMDQANILTDIVEFDSLTSQYASQSTSKR